MKIIKVLAKSSVKNSKKDTLAIKLSIFLAVVLLGTVVFIIDSLRTEKFNSIVSTIGDYQVSLSEVNNEVYNSLTSNKNIEKISFDKIIETDFGGTIYEKGKYGQDLEGFNIKKGRESDNATELIVPERFIDKNKNLAIGSEIIVKNKKYTIVGIYDDYGYSFEESILIGKSDGITSQDLKSDNISIVANIWFKNPRDTYTFTREILKDLNINEWEAQNTGRLYYNKDILEYKMIYPSGLIPPRHVISNAVESYGPLLILSLLFAVMIYGAFNVWNNRDLREIALLKSVGMTQKQIKKMIRLKSLNLAIFPLVLGILFSYIASNLLLYAMWINNKLSYINMSKILGESMLTPKFEIIIPTISAIVSITLLSLFTVYVSAMIPARKSSKLKIIEGLNGITEKNIKLGKSKIKGKIEHTLAKDYYRSYKSTYRVIMISMLISAVVITIVLVSQSYRSLLEKYDSFDSPYNFTSSIYTEDKLNRNIVDDFKKLEGLDEFHIYQTKDYKFFFNDNKDALSNEFLKILNTGGKDKDKLYSRIFALADEDFEKILKANNLPKNSEYLLLNNISSDNSTPYAFREYIPIINKDNKNINLRYNAKGQKMNIKIDTFINEMPYNLSAYENNEITIFTKKSTYDNFVEKNGKDPGDKVNYYTIKIKAADNLNKITARSEEIISSYVPKSDYDISNDIIKEAMDSEQLRNEHLLNSGIQLILIMIALSNAYNSFRINLRTRKRDFKLLTTTGMTEKQIRSMIYGEASILIKHLGISFVLIFFLVTIVRAYRSNFTLGFALKNILEKLNYFPIIVVFLTIILGIYFAIQKSTELILKENN